MTSRTGATRLPTAIAVPEKRRPTLSATYCTTSVLTSMTDATPQDAAQWMAGELERRGYLEQAYAVAEIERKFGGDFVYQNDNGNPAIDKRIIRAFRKLTEETVIWDRWDFAWRKRRPGDAPSRKQE
jgi:hypothetical protein